MDYQMIKAEVIKYDVIEALDYYDSVSSTLGIRFENELNIAFDNLEKHPHHYFNLKKDYRRIPLKSFPYMVVYRIEQQTVIVVAVFH